MNFKKMIALVLVMVLTAAVTFGATVAFLTDETEIKHNVFTIGNVDIEITEKVSDTSNGKATETSEGAQYVLVAPGDKLEKEVVVSNKGLLDAYVAVTVKLNNANEINVIDDYELAPYNYSDDQIAAIYNQVFDGWGLNYHKDLDGDGVADAGMRLTITGDDMPEYVLQVDSVKTIDEYAMFYTGNWFGEQSDIIPFDGFYTSDMDKYEIKYTYYMLLPAGKSTKLFEGLNVPEYFTAEQLAMFNGLTIDISGKAIQADNFASAKEAFEALYSMSQPAVPDVTVSTTDDLAAALNAGADVIQLKAGTYGIPSAIGGKTVTLIGTEGTQIDFTKAYNVSNANITFENIYFEGKNANVMNGYGLHHTTGDILFKNCTFNNAVTSENNANVTYENCTFTGTYYIATYAAKSVTFLGCTFDRTDSRAILVYSHGDNPVQVLVKDCTFTAGEQGFTGTGAWTAAVEVDTTNIKTAGTTVTIENCTIDANYSGIVRDKSSAGATPAVIVVDGVTQ